MARNIVILGAGFGGIRTALDLARGVPKDWHIFLVDRNAYHVYYPRLYELIMPEARSQPAQAGMSEQTGQKLGAQCTVDVKEILRGTRVEFVQGEVNEIDCKGKAVEVTLSSSPLQKGEKKLEYDYLVLALGADTDYFGIPGLQEYGCTLKSLNDAEVIRTKVRGFLESVKKGKTREKFDVIIGGAGATGVEVAAELANLFVRLPRQLWSVTLVEALRNVLWMFPSPVSQYAHKKLEELGVHLMLDTCIKEVGKSPPAIGEREVEVVLAPRPLKPGEKEETLACEFLPEHEKRVRADILLWAGGIRANPLISKCGLSTDRKGRMEVDEHLQVKGLDGLFAIGDNALLMDPAVNQPVPATAQAALLQGKIVAENIARRVRGQAMMLYPFPKFPAIVPLANRDGVALVRGRVVRGFLAWLLRQAADFRYYASILPWWKALKLCV